MPKSRVVLLVDDRLPEIDEIERGIDPALYARILTGSSVEELAASLSSGDVEFVIIGAGLPPDQRQQMIEHILDHGKGVSIHLQPTTDGPRGIVEFVNGVLTGLAWHQWDWSGSLAKQKQESPPPAARPQAKRKRKILRRIWDYVFGRSEPPVHPPPPPYSPGAGV